MKKPIVIKIFDEKGHLVEVRQFDKDQIVFGHQGEVDLDLESSEVAPIHALIEKREGSYFLCDLGSQSGTLLNGKNILDEAIQDGDKIQIGPYRMEFYIGLSKKTEATTQKDDSEALPPPIPQSDSEAYGSSKKDSKENKYKGALKLPGKWEEPPKVASEPLEKGPKYKEQKRHTPGTFAPPSAYKSVKDFIRGEKGSVVEVLVVWQERILESYHFSKRQVVRIGTSESNDIVVPLGSGNKTQPFLKVNNGVVVCLTSDMKGEVVSGNKSQSLLELSKSEKIDKSGKYYQLNLQQGQMACIEVSAGGVSLYVRYTAEMPTPILAPPLAMTLSEITGTVLSFVLVGLLALYMLVYSPEKIIEEEDKNQIRIAKFIYKAPEKPLPKLEKVVLKKKVRKKVLKKVHVKKRAKKVKRKKKKIKISGRSNSKRKLKKGKAAKVRKFKTKRKRPKKFTSSKSGGGVKLGKKAGAGAKSRKKDISKLGLFSAFGNKGTREKLDKSYSGAGGLLGLADKATGASGSSESRAGQDVGTKLKSTGAAGKGIAVQGIAKVGTKGRSSGHSGYGRASLGSKKSMQITPGGQEERFVGSIDREAVRRVVRAGLSAIRSCYERALNRKSGLSGKIVMQWSIVEHGRATKAIIKSSTLNDKKMQKCMKNRLLTWKFPYPPQGSYAEVTYPFVFNSSR